MAISTTHRGRSGTRAALVALVAGLVLAGCGSDQAPEADGPVVPAAAPAEWRAVEQGQVTVQVPPTFEEADPGNANPAPGARGFLLVGPADEDGRSAGVTTTTTTSPQRSAAEEAEALEVTWNATQGVEDVERVAVEWPGADAATFVAFEVDTAGQGEETAVFRFEWLIADVTDGSQVIVGVTGPVEEFRDQDLHRVLASLDIGP